MCSSLRRFQFVRDVIVPGTVTSQFGVDFLQRCSLLQVCIVFKVHHILFEKVEESQPCTDRKVLRGCRR